jgi:hypothetical protein
VRYIQTVDVCDANDFLKAISSNTFIRLKKGIYNLSHASNISNSCIAWEKVHDGLEPLIHNIENLTIEGEKGSEIVIEPKYGWVLSFQNVKQVYISNVTLGHVSSGFCTGGVISFVESDNVHIENTILFGSGTTGLHLDRADHFSLTGSTIRDCTYDLLGIYNSKYILFNNCSFEDTGEYNLISVSDVSRDVRFENCLIRNNRTGDFMPYLFNIAEDTDPVLLDNCSIVGNHIVKFTNRINGLIMKNTFFSGNTFSDYSEQDLNR